MRPSRRVWPWSDVAKAPPATLTVPKVPLATVVTRVASEPTARNKTLPRPLALAGRMLALGCLVLPAKKVPLPVLPTRPEAAQVPRPSAVRANGPFMRLGRPILSVLLARLVLGGPTAAPIPLSGEPAQQPSHRHGQRGHGGIHSFPLKCTTPSPPIVSRDGPSREVSFSTVDSLCRVGS
jgi:hypothetical protein